MTLQEQIANANAQAFECQRLQQLRMIDKARRQAAQQAPRVRNGLFGNNDPFGSYSGPVYQEEPRPRKTVESRVVEPRMLNA